MSFDQANPSVEIAQKEGLSNLMRWYSAKRLKDDYEFHRDTRPYEGGYKYMPGFAFKFAKYLGRLPHKAKTRERQLNEITTLFSTLENDQTFPTTLEKAKFAYNFLDHTQREIEKNEKNSMESGMVKLCAIIKSQISGAINDPIKDPSKKIDLAAERKKYKPLIIQYKEKIAQALHPKDAQKTKKKHS